MTTSMSSLKEEKTENGPPSFQVKLEEVEFNVPSTLDRSSDQLSQPSTKPSIMSAAKKRASNTTSNDRATKRRAVNQDPSSNNSRDEPVKKKRGRPPKVRRAEDRQITTPMVWKARPDVVKQEPIDHSLDRSQLFDSAQCHDASIQQKEPDEWDDIETHSQVGKPLTLDGVPVGLYPEPGQPLSNKSPSAKAPTEPKPPLPDAAWPHAWAQVLFTSL